MTGQPYLTGSLAPLVLSAHPVSHELLTPRAGTPIRAEIPTDPRHGRLDRICERALWPAVVVLVVLVTTILGAVLRMSWAQ